MSSAQIPSAKNNSHAKGVYSGVAHPDIFHQFHFIKVSLLTFKLTSSNTNLENPILLERLTQLPFPAPISDNCSFVYFLVVLPLELFSTEHL